jgi:hypothetical protein
MRKLTWLVTGLLCLNVAMPPGAAAQQEEKENPEDFGKDVLAHLLGPNWNVFLQGGVSMGSRFLLQRPAIGVGGEQSVETGTGWNIGVGGGGDYLVRQGYRLYYLYSNNKINFRTNNGDGSSNLDIDTNAKLHSNTLGIELIRYLLPSSATISPYGTLGISGTWWGLDSSPLVQAVGGSSQFRVGASVAFGVQVRQWEQFGVRLEASSLTIGNPFTGKNSFRTVGALPFDEPSGIGRWDYRLGGVYYFEKRSLLTKKTK